MLTRRESASTAGLSSEDKLSQLRVRALEVQDRNRYKCPRGIWERTAES